MGEICDSPIYFAISSKSHYLQVKIMMDIQANKLELIEWLDSIQDAKLVSKLRLVQQSFQSKSSVSDQEKRAIDQGLVSIGQGSVHSYDNVKAATKEKFPQLFK